MTYGHANRLSDHRNWHGSDGLYDRPGNLQPGGYDQAINISLAGSFDRIWKLVKSSGVEVGGWC
ncbi:MAG: hypothetical protein IPP27_06910 [Bacteroidetes bacterium]|nr:hypothetical protein [Bacteroidota bacterium]